MLRWLAYLCVAVLLIAVITSPTEREFRSFAASTADTSFCKPFVRYRPYRIMYFDLFSINTTRDCGASHILEPNKTLMVADKPDRVEHRYLGLFGTFWKL